AGKPRLSSVVALDDWTEAELVRLAASLETGSEHPLANALSEAAQVRRLSLSKPQQFRAVVGKGVVGQVDGRALAIGNRALLEELGVVAHALHGPADDLRGDGQTVVFMVVDARPAGLLGISDPIKESTPEAIRLLHDDGVRIVMVTGDTQSTAQAVARKLGID